MSCRKRKRWHFRDPKFETFLREHAPRLPQVWGASSVLTFTSPACTFKISRYAVNYRHLVAYEINAQGWKKRLSLGGGGVHFKNCYCQGGVQLSYVIILAGYSFDTPHFSENPHPPPPGRNKRTVP